MRSDALRVAAALFAAAATPATIFALVEFKDQSQYFSGATSQYAFSAAGNIWLITFIVASLHAVILGLPAYFFARRFHLAFWWASIAFGFIIGFVPFAVISWPMTHIHAGYRAWDGKEMVDYLIDGMPTESGWIQYIYSSCAAGALGMVSGFVAWLVWRVVAIFTNSQSAQSASSV